MRITFVSEAGLQQPTAMLTQWLETLGCDVQLFEAGESPLADLLYRLAEALAEKRTDCGIVLGGTGNAELMLLHRLPAVRSCLCWNRSSARLARDELQANVLVLSHRSLPLTRMPLIIEAWLHKPGSSHSRHQAWPPLLTGFPPQKNGRQALLAPFLDRSRFVCEHCRQEFAFVVDYFDGPQQEVIEECPVCGTENRIFVEIDARGKIASWGDPDLER
ncbi:MAG: hypothetical protein KatS3mg114_1367 [Planctomycetaceae bacterium]|nr:MAG: hypothetical protein KatS3mg114_1367 [Planctomycetaceae bacterium]